MISLLIFVLFPIALLDSLSMIPLCVVPLAALLGGKKPFLGAAGLLGGVFMAYSGVGILLLLGLDSLLDTVAPGIARLWNDPNTPELILQLAIGVILLAYGSRLASTRSPRPERSSPDALTPVGAAVLGMGLTLAGVPGALPYFGAIDQILRADLALLPSLLALLLYNLVFLLPLATIVLVRVLLPKRSEQISRRVASLSERWGRRLIVGVLLIIGAVFTADAIGWFLGHPLLPFQT